MSNAILYEVFRTRFEGEKLPSKDAVVCTRRVGHLTYFERKPDPRPGRSIWLATLVQPDHETYIIPALDRARLRRIDGGILISGIEIVPRGRGMKNIKSDNYPQTWFCRPVATPRGSFDDDDFINFGNPAEARRRAREDQQATLREGQKVAEAICRRPARRVPYDPSTASDHYLGHF